MDSESWSENPRQLWGLAVYSKDGRLIGSIDSIVDEYHGPMRAIVHPADRRRPAILVDLTHAVLRNGAVRLDPEPETETYRSENGETRLTLTWPPGTTRRIG